MISADLTIVGAGYAGINALNAASKYLPRGLKVVVVDRRRGQEWGGMWNEDILAYGFVRLHQPKDQFTAGEREWFVGSNTNDNRKEWDYLPDRREVLDHFGSVVASVVEETGIELMMLWGHSAMNATTVDATVAVERKVHLTARKLLSPFNGGDVLIVFGQLI